MKRKIFFLFLLSLFFKSNLEAQNQRLVFRHITSEHGLSQNHGMCILQDRKGFMWFGTNDGLNKYNGKKITIYKSDPEDSASISSSMITVIYEDRDSNLWVGTRNGLNLYNRDTDTFTRFKVNSGEAESVIYAILQDSDHNFWIGSSTGFYLFNKERKSFYPYLTETPSTCLYEDKDNNLWIGTRSVGLYYFDRKKNKFKNYPQTRISAIAEDDYGNLWIGTWGEGLYLFDRKKEAFTVNYKHDFRRPHTISKDIIYTLYKDHSHRLWVGTENGGLNLFDPVKGTFQKYENEAQNKSSLSNNSVSAIYEDAIGTLWVGVHRGGINYCNERLEKFQVFRQDLCKNGLSHNNIKGFCEDDDGRVWIATDGGGLNVFDPVQNTFTYFTNDPKNPNSLSSDVVLTVYKDTQGTIWAGTYLKGIDRYDKKTNSFVHYRHDPDNDKSLSHNNVWNILEDSRGRFWIGTHEGGVNLFDRKSGNFIQYFSDPENSRSLSDNLVTVIFEDKQKNIWIGTQNGLNLFDAATNGFTRIYNDKNKRGSLTDNNIQAMYQDKAGNLWVGTANGLNLFDPVTATAKAFTTKDGFPGNSILSILEDNHGALWMSTLEGIFKFNYKLNTIRSYQLADGWQGNEFIQNAALKTRNGNMIFGGINGFNFFNPDEVRDNNFIPPVYIVGFQLFNGPVGIGGDSPLKKEISQAAEVTLSYAQSVFSFEFAALNYVEPDKNKYAYKMVGFDKDWHEVGGQNFATYTNLDPGEYVFRVNASNNDGIWNEEGAAIKVIIHPPIWLTWWFKVLVGLSAAASVLLFIKIRTNGINKQKLELDFQVKQRTAEIIEQKEALLEQAANMRSLNDKLKTQAEFLQNVNELLRQQKQEIVEKREEAETARLEAEKANQAKSIFLATMSHEIRTPLNGVIGMASLMAETPLNAEQREYAQIIVHSGETLLGVINDILDFSKIESGNMELEVKDFDLRSCIEEVLDLFASKASENGLDLVYQVDHDVPYQILGDSLRLRQVLLNLIGNSLKFTHEGEIFVGVHLFKKDDTGVELKFEIRDTGIGIPAEKLSQLFKSFSQVDASTTRKYGGTGLGLAITEKLVELMRGHIWVESTFGKGSTFFFTIKTKLGEVPTKAYVHNMASMEGKKVLVVDDNATNRLILKNHLELWKLKTTLAFSGKHALDVLEQNSDFDLVLTDMQMPEMDGLQFGKIIRERYPNLPVILLSSIGDERNAKYADVFASVLSKPVKPTLLCRSIIKEFQHEKEVAVPESKSQAKLRSNFAQQYPFRILVAEDNPVNQKLATIVLSKLGYVPEVAANGKEAIDVVIKNGCNLIFMDIQMPEMDGLEATRRIRALSSIKQPIIIAMTANAMQGDRDACIQAGMDDYISKPINLDALVTVLEKRAAK